MLPVLLLGDSADDTTKVFLDPVGLESAISSVASEFAKQCIKLMLIFDWESLKRSDGSKDSIR